MKESIKKVYDCDFCKKKMFRKHAMENHEKWCYHNPENTPKCSSCIYLMQIDITYNFDTYGGEANRQTKGFRCEKKCIELYPLNAVRLGYVDRYPETFEDKHLMPKSCDEFKDEYKLPF